MCTRPIYQDEAAFLPLTVSLVTIYWDRYFIEALSFTIYFTVICVKFIQAWRCSSSRPVVSIWTVIWNINYLSWWRLFHPADFKAILTAKWRYGLPLPMWVLSPISANPGPMLLHTFSSEKPSQTGRATGICAVYWSATGRLAGSSKLCRPGWVQEVSCLPDLTAFLVFNKWHRRMEEKWVVDGSAKFGIYILERGGWFVVVKSPYTLSIWPRECSSSPQWSFLCFCSSIVCHHIPISNRHICFIPAAVIHENNPREVISSIHSMSSNGRLHIPCSRLMM